MRIINVVGARPNFMKIAPLMEAYRAYPTIKPYLVHTGQHYDAKMSDLFFCQLGIPRPDTNLGVGGGSHAVNTAETMKAFEPICLEQRPDAVLVVGDVNSTIACSLVASKLGIKVIHVEAGLRSGDRTMPEEINRVLTDTISDLLFCTEQSGVDNLLREGVSPDKIHLVGNVMIDTLLKNRRKAQGSPILKDLDLAEREYAVLTLHRPANVDDHEIFSGILDALEVVQRDLSIIFPIHPRTAHNLRQNGLGARLDAMKRVRLIEPVGYLDFLKLMSAARLVLTDSGGIQEETTILGVPCLTLRNNTERPVTIECGMNLLVGNRAPGIIAGYGQLMAGDVAGRIPPLWDGQAAERIVQVLVEQFGPSD